MFSKKLSKIAAVVTSLVLAAGIMLPSFGGVAEAAEAPTGSITITVPESDKGTHSYKAYQIFSADSSDTGLTNIAWGSAIGTPSEEMVTKLAAIDGFSTCGNDAAKYADALSAITATDADLSKAFADAVAGYVTGGKAADQTNKITGLATGYYLVMDASNPTGTGTTPGTDNSGAYTRYILEVVEGANVNVTAKTSAPTLVKKVEELGYEGTLDGAYNDVADYSIGDTINFRIYVTVADNYKDFKGAYSMIVTDEMDEGLTFGEVTSVTVDNNEIGVGNCVVNKESDQKFTVTFPNLKAVTTDLKGKTIVITYTATLNANAVIGLDGNVNKASLKYSNNPNSTTTTTDGTTPEDKVIVFTYSLGVDKVDAKDATKLEGAEFVIYKTTGTSYVIADGGKVTGFTTSKDDATKFTTDANGFVSVAGLEDGDYTIEEVKAPEGYNLPTGDAAKTAITIAATTVNGQNWVSGKTAADALTAITCNDEAGVLTLTADAPVNVSVEIKNSKGSSLPTTGGMGTKILYIVGGILVVGAAVLLISKKRMDSEE